MWSSPFFYSLKDGAGAIVSGNYSTVHTLSHRKSHKRKHYIQDQKPNLQRKQLAQERMLLPQRSPRPIGIRLLVILHLHAPILCLHVDLIAHPPLRLRRPVGRVPDEAALRVVRGAERGDVRGERAGETQGAGVRGEGERPAEGVGDAEGYVSAYGARFEVYGRTGVGVGVVLHRTEVILRTQ